jgi:hypothetical protein
MLSLLNLPALPYIIFEMIKYTIKEPTYSEDSTKMEDLSVVSKPIETDILLMDVQPETINYDYGAKQGYQVGPGDGNTLVNKGGLAPVKIQFAGCFGKRFIQRGIKVQDGFGRLKEFRAMYKKSNSIPLNLKDGEQPCVYGMNYYDFNFHEWMAVNLDTFRIRADTKRHSTVPMYELQMTGIGKLIDVETADPILRNLRYLIDIQNKFDEWNSEIDSFLKENSILAGINEILVDIASFEEALNIAVIMGNNYEGAITNSFLGDAWRLGSGIANGLNNISNFNNTLKDFISLLY